MRSKVVLCGCIWLNVIETPRCVQLISLSFARVHLQSLDTPTLDSLLLDGTWLGEGATPPASVDLVKIDTAGGECDVLDGGTRALFHKLRPRVIVVNVDAPASDACARALAAKHAFTVHDIGTRPGSGRHVIMVDRRGSGRNHEALGGGDAVVRGRLAGVRASVV